MPFIVIIPARYESTLLPGKPLKDIAGTSMIQRVWQQAIKSGASRVIIATDDERIKQAASDFGAEVCMTRDDHVSGTDRLQEVANILALKGDQLVGNVQGDEPLIPPAVIDCLVRSSVSVDMTSSPWTPLTGERRLPISFGASSLVSMMEISPRPPDRQVSRLP